ncbi:putative HTH-type transcriptional regulator [Zhongshania aliphaticivorans]|uniref:Putative HTH-type transcriptional regulator n=2 Tax=Zhongshania aliphaticivorans TaxID=1470434 RepID=A0A5S9QKH2_9GAMM|nr:putative HTH-type transcriptional regulator [Zhongshania aliphaticivorans]CAA0118559.1 putative HTH-type transcriptional regulator [Zhongshania aliphaticivorans]
MGNTRNLLRPVAISKVMINFATNEGVDLDTCLLGSGITEDMLNDGSALIETEQEMRLIENLMLALPHIPTLGFRMGLSYSIATFGIWGFTLRTCRTLQDALHTALRFLPLSTAYCELSSFKQDGYFYLQMDPQSIPSHLRQFLLERDMAASIAIVKELSLNEVQSINIEFTGAPIEETEFIAATCNTTPRFQSTMNALKLPSKYADKPLPTYDSNLARMLTDQCARQLRQRQSGGTAERVRQQILGNLGLSASLDDAAAALIMSSRTLRRKLDAEQTSFRAIVEEERKQMAYQLLTDSDMKLEELAAHLGYTDTSSFTRAFRRWNGGSPSDYRLSNRDS